MAIYKVDLDVVEQTKNTRTDYICTLLTEYITADSKLEAQEKVLGWAQKSLVDNDNVDIVDVEVTSVEIQDEKDFINGRIGNPAFNK